MEESYRPRIVDGYFKERLQASGALLIQGPKWCGKTTTAEMMSSSALYMQDPDTREINLYYASNKPSRLLEGERPRLIDEWQIAPVLWDAVRFSVDKEKKRGQFILTGSATPNLKKEEEDKMHTGTGRIARVSMHTMSLYESGESEGSVSLAGLFDGTTDFDAESDLTLERLAFLASRGGWPGSLDMDDKYSLRVPKDYLESIIYSDVPRADNTISNPDITRAVIASLSRNVCTLADNTAISADVREHANRQTTLKYLAALKRIFVVEDVPAWRPELMSKTRLRTSPKRCLTDPSIAVAALGAGPDALMRDLPAFGSIFESLCIRDLRVYSQPLDGTVRHYHDSAGLEVDSIITLDDGRWGAIEIKLHSGEDEAAKNLLKLKKKLILKDGSGPSFLAVLTGSGFFHRRDDGVLVIPIGCLGP